VLELADLMQHHRLNKSKREEVVPNYKFASPSYIQKGHENEEFEQKVHNSEPLKFIKLLSKKPQLTISKYPKELNWYM
jgi:hypothetical protein